MRPDHVFIVGAGISGATVARVLADGGIRSTVYEGDATVGGMCRETVWKGHAVSEFGPHIFRTSSELLWKFITRFSDFIEGRHHVSTSMAGRLVPFPPAISVAPTSAQFLSLGDYLVAALGTKMFEEFYADYTLKRWGVSAFGLSPTMIPLVPVRRHTGGFFGEAHVGIPSQGYTVLIQRMLDHSLIDVRLRARLRESDISATDLTIWTGRLDEVHAADGIGLPFRSVRQEFMDRPDTDDGDPPVVNFPLLSDLHIRRTDYGLLLPWQPPVVGLEYVEESGPPAYPVLTTLAEEKAIGLMKRVRRERPNVIPHGRLGTFSYISMDQAVATSLELGQKLLGGSR